MFGLGATEILVIAAVIVLVAGPKALGKVFKTAKKAQELRSKLSPQAMLSELMSEPKSAKAKKKKKASKSASKGDSSKAE